MRALRLILAAAVAVPALAFAAGALAQAEIDTEGPSRKVEEAEAARVKPLIEAEKLRPRLSGTWRAETYIPAIKTTDGKLPPLTRDARRLYNQRIADRKAGKADDLVNVCLPPGTPRVLYQTVPFMLVQTPTKVTFYHEFHHVIRHVYLDGPLKDELPDLGPNWQGYNSGRWEGDALVIESGFFNGKLWMDEAGLPQSEKMRILERIRLVDPDTIEDTLTFTDPDNYTAPWSTQVRFKRLPDDTLIKEETCTEKLLETPMKEYAPVPGR